MAAVNEGINLLCHAVTLTYTGNGSDAFTPAQWIQIWNDQNTTSHLRMSL
jgi:hypothetical protein